MPFSLQPRPLRRIRRRTLVASLAGALLAPAAAAAQAPGSHDTSFGTNGFAFLGLIRDGEMPPRMAEGMAIVRQPGGRLVSAATFLNYNRRLDRFSTTVGLLRVTSTGAKDRTFGRGGEAVTNVPGAVNERTTSLARRSDGRLVLAGTAGGRMLAVRYTAAGRPDRSFGGDGSIVVSPGTGADVANDLQPRSGGRTLLAGQSGTRGALVGLGADGRLDRGFGRGGKVLLDLGPRVDRLTGVEIDPQGRILVSGTSGLTAVVARLSAKGKLDRSFGSNGVARVSEAGGRALALDSRGRALLAGVNYRGRGPDRNGRPVGNGLITARFTTRGTLDRGYAARGVLRLVTLGAGGAVAGTPTGVVLDPAGRALVSGHTSSCAYVVRLTSAGALDTGFGQGDPSRVEAGAGPIGYWCPSASQILEPGLDPSEGGASTYAGLLVQPDRRIVAVGTMGVAETGDGNRAVIARYYG